MAENSNQKRESEKRIRGTTLQNIRRKFFEKYPLCKHCDQKGVVREATELDHITPLFKGGRNHESNYQGLCEACHKEKSAKDAGYQYQPKRRIGLDGWPIDE